MSPLNALFLLVCLSWSLASELEGVEQEWSSFKSSHSKQYDPKEETHRKGLFERCHQDIVKHNNDKSQTFKLGHNSLSDKTLEEKAARCGKKSSPSTRFNRYSYSNIATFTATDSERALPASYDLRNASTCVGPIKDQGQCGSCWAFSAIAALEFSQCKTKNSGKYAPLSEQQLVDCDTGDWGCDGGDTPYNGVWPWLKTNNKGVDTQSSYPYSTATHDNGVEGICTYSTTTLGVKGISSYGKVASGATSIQTALQTYGTLAACLFVPETDNTFFQYKSGVYVHSTCTASFVANNGGNHCVNLVGWGVSSTNVPYWIMRNQWATSWGISGYMQIKRGVNMCGIESEVGYVVVA